MNSVYEGFEVAHGYFRDVNTSASERHPYTRFTLERPNPEKDLHLEASRAIPLKNGEFGACLFDAKGALSAVYMQEKGVVEVCSEVKTKKTGVLTSITLLVFIFSLIIFKGENKETLRLVIEILTGAFFSVSVGVIANIIFEAKAKINEKHQQKIMSAVSLWEANKDKPVSRELTRI